MSDSFDLALSHFFLVRLPGIVALVLQMTIDVEINFSVTGF